MKLYLCERFFMRFSITYRGCIIEMFEGEKERGRIYKGRVEKLLRDVVGFRERE